MKKFYIIAYDIANDKKRTKVHKLLKEYGTSINLSVFECCITEKQLSSIKETILSMVAKKDIVVFYHICSNCYQKTDRINFNYHDIKTIHTV